MQQGNRGQRFSLTSRKTTGFSLGEAPLVIPLRSIRDFPTESSWKVTFTTDNLGVSRGQPELGEKFMAESEDNLIDLRALNYRLVIFLNQCLR